MQKASVYRIQIPFNLLKPATKKLLGSACSGTACYEKKGLSSDVQSIACLAYFGYVAAKRYFRHFVCH